MTVVYPSLESPEFAAGFQAALADIDGLAELFERYRIGAQAPGALEAATVAAFETVVERLNTVLATRQTLGAYINGFVTTNSRDDLAQARRSELDQHGVRLAQLATRFTAWIGALDVEGLIAQSE